MTVVLGIYIEYEVFPHYYYMCLYKKHGVLQYSKEYRNAILHMKTMK